MGNTVRDHICRVNKAEQLPPGYVKITTRDPRVSEGSISSFNAWLNRAIKSKDREGWINDPYAVGGTKDNYTGGCLYVHEADFDRLVVEYLRQRDVDLAREPQASAFGLQMQSASLALCEINNGLAEIRSTLRDLVAAVLLLGEQHSKQREAVGSRRDMNGEAL